MTIVGAAKVKALLLIASQLSGYPVPDAPLPPVSIVSHEEMAKAACDGVDGLFGCTVIGFFEFPHDGKPERVLVDGDIEEHSPDAIMVHELTHWLQYHNWSHPDVRVCPREFLREYQAYLAGYRYEVIFEHKKAPESFDLPGLECDFTLSSALPLAR